MRYVVKPAAPVDILPDSSAVYRRKYQIKLFEKPPAQVTDLILGILLFLIYHTNRLKTGAGALKLLFAGGLYFKDNELILWFLILLILTVSFKGIHSIYNLPWEKSFPVAPLIFFSTIILIFFCIFIPS